MINIKYKTQSNSIIKNIDKHKSLLIMGRANTMYNVGRISYINSISEMNKNYGVDSELSEAYRISKGIGVKNIFVINIRSYSDYIDCMDIISQHDFSYIVPIGIGLNESYYVNDMSSKKKSLAYFYSKLKNDSCNSVFLFTDKHASLYENIDDFINDMKEKIDLIKLELSTINSNGEKICIVANNLKDYKYSNLILGSVLCITEVGKYPFYDYGECIFDIDLFDVNMIHMSYFKERLDNETTIDNMTNLRYEIDALKDINIERVVTYINRELDFNAYIGKPYSPKIKMSLYNMLSTFMQKLIGDKIRGYKIKSINFIKTNPGECIIEIDMYITPINSIEGFNILMEV